MPDCGHLGGEHLDEGAGACRPHSPHHNWGLLFRNRFSGSWSTFKAYGSDLDPQHFLSNKPLQITTDVLTRGDFTYQMRILPCLCAKWLCTVQCSEDRSGSAPLIRIHIIPSGIRNINWFSNKTCLTYRQNRVIFSEYTLIFCRHLTNCVLCSSWSYLQNHSFRIHLEVKYAWPRPWYLSMDINMKYIRTTTRSFICVHLLTCSIREKKTCRNGYINAQLSCYVLSPKM